MTNKCTHPNYEYEQYLNEHKVLMAHAKCDDCGLDSHSPIFLNPKKEDYNLTAIEVLNKILNHPESTITVAKDDVVTIPVYKILQAMEFYCGKKVMSIADKQGILK